MNRDSDWADPIFTVQGGRRRRWAWLALVALVLTASVVLVFVPTSTPAASPSTPAPVPVSAPRVAPTAADQAREPLPRLGAPRKQGSKRTLVATTPHVDLLEDRQ